LEFSNAAPPAKPHFFIQIIAEISAGLQIRQGSGREYDFSRLTFLMESSLIKQNALKGIATGIMPQMQRSIPESGVAQSGIVSGCLTPANLSQTNFKRRRDT